MKKTTPLIILAILVIAVLVYIFTNQKASEVETVAVDSTTMTLEMKEWEWQSALYNDGREVMPAQPEDFTLTFNDGGTFITSTDCNTIGGGYSVAENLITFENIFSTQMYCEDSVEGEFTKILENAVMYHFTDQGELVLDLRYDSGSAIFR